MMINNFKPAESMQIGKVRSTTHFGGNHVWQDSAGIKRNDRVFDGVDIDLYW
jgi:hypothetical protein